MNKFFVSAIKAIIIVAGVFFLVSFSEKNKSSREFYQLIIYHFTTIKQETALDEYLQKALLPALHKKSNKPVGIFKAIANDTSASKLLYVLVPLKKLEEADQMTKYLASDKEYLANGAAYINASYTDPLYNRMETIILRAFPLAPQLQMPSLKQPRKERVYELRSYESATEKIFANKVHMFNEGGEIDLFKKLNFNAIFYSEVVAGSKMPNLMYMTSFENMTDRDNHWKTFGNDTTWKRLSGMSLYQNNVSHIDITFLRPAEYSDY